MPTVKKGGTRTKFLARDQKAAMKEGWFLDTSTSRIVVDEDDERERFRMKDEDGIEYSDDDLAVAYVVGRAEAGCDRAIRALTIMWEDGDADARASMLGWMPRTGTGRKRKTRGSAR